MVLRNKITRLVLFGLGIVSGVVGKGYWNEWYGRNAENNKTSLVTEASLAVSACTGCTNEKTALEQKLTLKDQEYNTCIAEKGQQQQQFEAASKVSDTRYLTLKAIIESNRSDAEKGEELSKEVGRYIFNINSDKLFGEVYVSGDSCQKAIPKLYSMMTSIRDSELQEAFTGILLRDSRICNLTSPELGYVVLKSNK